MKILKTGALCVLLSLCMAGSYAQNNSISQAETSNARTKIFADLPLKINLDVPVEALLQYNVGDKVDLNVGKTFLLKGVVVSKSDPADVHSTTIIIKCTSRQGTAFTLTRIKTGDGTYDYNGRILGFKNSDAYELEKEKSGYVLVKKDMADMLSE